MALSPAASRSSERLAARPRSREDSRRRCAASMRMAATWDCASMCAELTCSEKFVILRSNATCSAFSSLLSCASFPRNSRKAKSIFSDFGAASSAAVSSSGDACTSPLSWSRPRACSTIFKARSVSPMVRSKRCCSALISSAANSAEAVASLSCLAFSAQVALAIRASLAKRCSWRASSRLAVASSSDSRCSAATKLVFCARLSEHHWSTRCARLRPASASRLRSPTYWISTGATATFASALLSGAGGAPLAAFSVTAEWAAATDSATRAALALMAAGRLR
mmetsp:Transcript_6764/g.19234  ORF Transcript_6764/g.19234 Transcript_6764/m.19234 type:complete len:281 (+) Transcript_6764:500-1342(+)